MRRLSGGRSAYVGLAFGVLGLVAWATGRPFVFPSLGPSAFILAFEWRGDRVRASRVVGGHAVGAVAGLVAYSLLGGGVVVTTSVPPLSPAGLHLAASGTLSLVLTSAGMRATGTTHAPACATTLIVSLGLLSTPLDVAVVVASVVLLVGTHAVVVSVSDAVGGPDPMPSDWADD